MFTYTRIVYTSAIRSGTTGHYVRRSRSERSETERSGARSWELRTSGRRASVRGTLLASEDAVVDR